MVRKPPAVATPLSVRVPSKECVGAAAAAGSAKASLVTVPVAVPLVRSAAVSTDLVTAPLPVSGSPGTAVAAYAGLAASGENGTRTRASTRKANTAQQRRAYKTDTVNSSGRRRGSARILGTRGAAVEDPFGFDDMPRRHRRGSDVARTGRHRRAEVMGRATAADGQSAAR